MTTRDVDLIGITETRSVNRSEDAGQATRVWEHLLHEDGDFVQRSNYFLIGESMLVVAYAGILAGGQTGGSSDHNQWKVIVATKAIGVFGLLLTMAWIYVCHDHVQYLSRLRERAQEFLPEYRAFHTTNPHRFRSSNAVMAYGVPVLAATLWLVLIVLI
jgi:hypothetical protein